jgi:hypothetical protein
MAFFNLWSSERLSFSLSIVAVISAAITSYYQFFYHSTEVSYFKENSHFSKLPTFKDGMYNDSIVGSITFMNRGSTPVSIISSAVIIEVDSTEIDVEDFRENPRVSFSQGVVWGDSSTREMEYVHTKHYLDAKSVSEFRFETTIDSAKFGRLLKNSPITYNWEGWDSNTVVVYYHLWFLMADPFGEFSMEAVKIGHHVYNESGRYIFGFGDPNSHQTRDIPVFRDIDFWKDLSAEKDKKRMSISQGTH